MSDSAIDYGKLNKRIIFTDSDHRHAKFTLKLKHDGITQAHFFRSCITGYLEEDGRVRDFINEHIDMSKARKKKADTTRKRGEQKMKDFALNEGEIQNIFDILEQEFPDL